MFLSKDNLIGWWNISQLGQFGAFHFRRRLSAVSPRALDSGYVQRSVQLRMFHVHQYAWLHGRKQVQTIYVHQHSTKTTETNLEISSLIWSDKSFEIWLFSHSQIVRTNVHTHIANDDDNEYRPVPHIHVDQNSPAPLQFDFLKATLYLPWYLPSFISHRVTCLDSSCYQVSYGYTIIVPPER